jgi:DNA-binding MarR family transcriptional regulator/GNAT superfamily N-acetyltransferase
MDQIARVRSFNRTVTRRIGVLEDGFLGRDRPLGASRVLFEIGRDGVALAELRARLGLDSGYLSRLFRGLEEEGLVEVVPDPADRRARRASVTAAGLEEIEVLDRLSDEGAEALLAGLPARQRERLVAAMGEVERLLTASAVSIERLDPSGEEARWCVAQYFAELGERFEEGFDAGETAPADAEELVPPRGVFLVARLDGRAVGCGAVKTWVAPSEDGPGIADIKRRWVAPEVRGLGVGRRMLEALEGEARALGFGVARLETNRALAEALGIYRSQGYAPIEPYSGDPYADFAFEREL